MRCQKNWLPAVLSLSYEGGELLALSKDFSEAQSVYISTRALSIHVKSFRALLPSHVGEGQGVGSVIPQYFAEFSVFL